MIDFQKLANEFGTPLYVYDAQKIRKRIAKAKKVFEGLDAEIVFALKANNNPSLLKIMAEQEIGADVVASSALMTTTMVNQIQIEEQLKEAGIRDSLKTMVGGAPVTQDWATKIGADLYGENATDVVTKLSALF